MIRKKSLIIAAASTQINLNHSINFFFPFFLSFSFSLSRSGCADIRTWAVPQTCLIVLYCSFPCKFFMASVLFPANFSCSLRQRRALITEVLKSVIFPFVFNWHHIKLNICTKRATSIPFSALNKTCYQNGHFLSGKMRSGFRKMAINANISFQFFQFPWKSCI